MHPTRWNAFRLAFALAGAGAALSGCVRPEPLPPSPSLPTHAAVAVSAPGVERAVIDLETTYDDEVALYDLAEVHGLTVQIDLVTGRRTCRDGEGNVVEVMPSARALVINGAVHPLAGMVRWRDGVLYVPGASRALLAEHLRLGTVPRISDDPGLFDGDARHLAIWQREEGGKPKPAARSVAASAPALPRGWAVDGGRPWRSIVIHHSATEAGDAAAFDREHRKKWKNGLGYHFVIGNGTTTGDGEIEVGPRWARQRLGVDGAHAGNKRYNKYGIGICLVGDFNGGKPTANQVASLRRLVKALMARYGIPATRIVAHKDVRRGHTDCPGKRFPIEAFRGSL